jgi:uncharacterized SAM-binding protein YcdF (DUF218 family)
MILVRLIRALILVAVFCVALWLVGFVWFVEQVKSLDAAVTDKNPQAVDAIVVLTGGSERVSTGVDLLNAGKGKKLFISGVHPGLSLDRVLGNQSVAGDLRGCCIVLGHVAESTQGNAEETQNWLALEDYHSLRLVTANYHMPRSLLLFRAAMPEVTIVPHPIAPDSVMIDEWGRHAGTASLLFTEYDKYLFASFILWAGLQ